MATLKPSDYHIASILSKAQLGNTCKSSQNHRQKANDDSYPFNNANQSNLISPLKRSTNKCNQVQYLQSSLANQEATNKQIANLTSLSRLERRKSLQQIGFGQPSSYKMVKLIGTGSYSSVFKCHSKVIDSMVAVKQICLQRDEGVPFTAIREASILRQLKHANIVTLHDLVYAKKCLLLVFEYLDCDLSTYMRRCDYCIEPHNIRLFLFQLLRGLSFCHENKILHRDLKPQNLLLDKRGQLKLADFGLARAKSVPIKTFTDEVVTLWYRPPDVLLGNRDYNASIDIWGLGCIFYELATGKTLFTGTSPNEQIKNIFNVLGMPKQHEWPNLRQQLEARKVNITSYSDISKCNNKSTSIFNDLESRIGLSGIELLIKCLKCAPNSRIHAYQAMKQQYFSALPEAVHSLEHHESIFTIQSIRLIPERSNITKPE